MYADNTSILYVAINPDKLKIITFTNTSHVTRYFKSHNLHTNLHKLYSVPNKVN